MDVMNPAQRSALMARIRSKNTGIEKLVFRELRARGVHFSRHVTCLSGKPDVAFKRERVAIFLDGDFWHGWRFARWCDKLQPYWREKIARNRARDCRNFRSLRRKGWTVLRVWEHQLKKDVAAAVDLMLSARTVAALKRQHERQGKDFTG